MYVYTTSRAKLKFVNNTVYKTANTPEVKDRIDEQSQWLSDHRLSVLPRVFNVWPGGYSMEKLDTIDWYRIDSVNGWENILQQICTSMKQIWTQPAAWDTPLYVFKTFLDQRIFEYAPHLYLSMDNWYNEIHHMDYEFQVCLTHGDNTFDNTCIRKDTGELVFIDPNPRKNVPSLLACDMAMLCQSVLGYEHFKFNHPKPRCDSKILKEIMSLSDEEWFLIQYFTAAKFIRILHYEDKHRQNFTLIAETLIKENGF